MHSYRHAVRLAIVPSILGLMAIGAGQAIAAPAVSHASTARLSTVRAQAPRDSYNCRTGTSIDAGGKSVSASAEVTSCTGNPLPTKCTARAALYAQAQGTTTWKLAGRGAVVTGCAGPMATVVLTCQRSTSTVKYQTRGTYTFTWEGKTYAGKDIGPSESVRLSCS